MRTCLLDPAQGYYASANAPGQQEALEEHGGRDVLGARGDFITSPEISQVFGELLAVYFVSRWQASSSPTSLRLIEFGPGKGTLLADMIRTFSRFPLLSHLKTIHLVETSEGLMRLQLSAIESALAAAGKRIAMPRNDGSSQAADEVHVEYFPHVDAVPIDPSQWTMLVAHEFFDALPIHIFERTVSGFRELLVDVQHQQRQAASGGVQEQRQSGVTTIKVSDLRSSSSSSSNSSKEGGKDATAAASSSTSTPSSPAFRYVLSPTETPWTKLLASSNPRFQRLQPGQRVEISPESWATARRIGELVAGKKAKPAPGQESDAAPSKEPDESASSGPSQGGAGLIVDYGDSKAFGGSFRAFKSHKIVDPLTNPGTADLTANVDFSYLSTALATTEAKGMGPMFQAHFLASLGLEPRVGALMNAVGDNDERKKVIEGAAKRLVDPTGMGAQYKVLGVHANAEGREGEDGEVYPFDSFPSSDGRAANPPTKGQEAAASSPPPGSGKT
ncbi:DUF185-domain-containing protein [Jaminaea rosea]|uniref:Protein arginine methyltransferase NDUFAF7 n=1 Tax=Jaminaea rosea TaxID=1569628 RepID=A0A316UNH6_9BASI|nr:DUF185-domain-containing protein [Jaminaea rosea]PWN24715.1 DUF185-domain-containing protein [Jaminaea rosea]